MVLVGAVSGVAVGLAGVRVMSAPFPSVGSGNADVEGLSFWKTQGSETEGAPLVLDLLNQGWGKL